MAQPTTFMLQHNNVSQVNDIYYTNNVTRKYLGYKYKFIFLLKKILKFSFIKKYKIKLKILMLKSTQKKTFKFLKNKLKPKVAKLGYINFFSKILTKINKNYIFNKYFFFKHLKKPKRRKRKFFKIRWSLKKKTLKRIFKKKRKPFNIGLIRLIKIKDITFLSYILKKIKYKRYNRLYRLNKFKISRIKKNVFLDRKESSNFTKKKRLRVCLMNKEYV